MDSWSGDVRSALRSSGLYKETGYVDFSSYACFHGDHFFDGMRGMNCSPEQTPSLALTGLETAVSSAGQATLQVTTLEFL